MSNQDIKCSVTTCKYNNHEKHCSLHDIMVGSSVSGEAHRKTETECASFESVQ